ncbi:hypothetical protein CI610_03075 [invertebrate metagenome]|uniref:Uncharacterized protein n=1 Tax=invertebrate metagenome TaxID=1711999 RepID=A0A2H9T442_9ZZZZ
MGLYDAGSCGFLPGFSIGITTAFFHASGIVPCCHMWFKSLSIISVMLFVQCLRMVYEMLSSPGDVFFLF